MYTIDIYMYLIDTFINSFKIICRTKQSKKKAQLNTSVNEDKNHFYLMKSRTFSHTEGILLKATEQ